MILVGVLAGVDWLLEMMAPAAPPKIVDVGDWIAAAVEDDRPALFLTIGLFCPPLPLDMESKWVNACGGLLTCVKMEGLLGLFFSLQSSQAWT